MSLPRALPLPLRLLLRLPLPLRSPSPLPPPFPPPLSLALLLWREKFAFRLLFMRGFYASRDPEGLRWKEEEERTKVEAEVGEEKEMTEA